MTSPLPATDAAPGFGNTIAPPRERFAYTFDTLAA